MFWLRMTAKPYPSLPYCPTALLPYCPTALLPYCLIHAAASSCSRIMRVASSWLVGWPNMKLCTYSQPIWRS
ncbi:hypothetical protein P040_02583 [Brucella melitensis 11-1823-3434]|nr:hypothetical protein P040_02583 [Brucella melitensis 11-1823-3434]